MAYSEQPTDSTSNACELSDGELSDIVGGENLARYDNDQLKARFIEYRDELRRVLKRGGFSDPLMTAVTQYRYEMQRRGMEIPKEDAQ